ncbi:MAG: hypothetical protein ACE37E_18785 [Hyphomicrobiales bacterium]|jgi:ElaB/YqjD/DUF883 family membrane-anchored ribosome-binding protein
MATAAQRKSANSRSASNELVDPKLVSEFDGQLSALRSDISDLTATVMAMADDSSRRAQDTATDLAKDGAEKLRETTKTVREQAQVAGDDAYAAGRAAAAQVQGNVAQNPFAALALAAGIGFLAGALAKR